MAYKYQGYKTGTRMVTVRVRQDLLDKMEMLCINRSRTINRLLEDYLRVVESSDGNTDLRLYYCE